ncbi:MAG: hypothetical protein JOY59_12785 [Candidatus Eremiobacteraeota bacterium]|nr:hypothetical protein [Candidatus Eremiobacteraeota bacterium]
MKVSTPPVAAAFFALPTLFTRFASDLLLRCYLGEVRKLEVPQAPNEAIHTYPLA